MMTVMALEIEIKFPDADIMAVRRRLQDMGAENLGLRHERNSVFDTPGRELRTGEILLRLRQAGECILTLKRPPKENVSGDPSRFKVWDEIETRVSDYESMRGILSGLGFVQSFAYEKLRETWRYMGCLVCLDRLPFYDCVEIEGGEESIAACADALDLDLERGSAANYQRLNTEYRSANGLPRDENFVFEPGEHPRMPWETESEAV